MKYGLYKRQIESRYGCAVEIVCDKSKLNTTAKASAWSGDKQLHSFLAISDQRSFAIFSALEGLALELEKSWLATQHDQSGQYDLFGHDRYKRC